MGDLPDNDLTPDEVEELNNLMMQGDEMLKYFRFDGKDYRLVVKIVNKSTNPVPAYAKDGDSGFDLRANLPGGQVTIPPGKVATIPTGNYFQIPKGWELQIRSRSGLAAKNGVMVLNSPGTVDSGYRGEVKAILFNTGAFGDFAINHGDRICQGVVAPVIHNVLFDQVSELDHSERGGKGFGSSGRK